MNETLVNLLKIIVEIIQSQGTRIEALEREEFVENADDASLIEAANNLLTQLQTSESVWQAVPSDEM
jgi:hypothetical protein